MAFRYVVSATVIVLGTVLVLVGCGSSPVAVVNGAEITEKQLYDRLVQNYGLDVLRDMIDRELIKQAAKEAGVEVTEEELNKEIEQGKAGLSEEEFNQWLATRNMTVEEWTEYLRMNVLARKLALKDVKYTEEDLRRYFEENKQNWSRPATVALSEIVVSSEADAREVLAELKKSEAKFGDVARRYSLSPTRQTGGERPEMPIESIPIEPVREAAQKLSIGQVSEPIAAEGQWYIIKVRDRQAARGASWELDREMIEEQYKYEHAKPLQDILREQIRKSNVRVLDPRFQSLNELYTPVPSELPGFGTQAPANRPAPAPTNQPAPAPAGGGQ
ncbi:MAG: peptidyl-prolyl cis-trans isomerase [Armatimonadota bacterium]